MKYLKIFLLITILLIILTGCNSIGEELTVEEKLNSELEYVENRVIEITNKIAKDEYLDEEEIDYDKLLEDVSKIESSAAIILVDLASQGVESAEIAKLSSGVNKIIMDIEAEDILNVMVDLNNIDSLIPTYMEKYSKDNEKVFKRRLKYYALSSFVAFSTGDTELSKAQIQEAESKYSEKMQDINYVNNNEYNLNKIYVLIEEMKGAVESNSYELVKLKYLSLIEEI